jgi:hypothetical protein
LDTCLISTLEVVAVSEVFGLMEQHPSATTIIAADIDADRANVIQRHHPTLQLKASATVQDIMPKNDIATSCRPARQYAMVLNSENS